jgi:hypothetical protein
MPPEGLRAALSVYRSLFELPEHSPFLDAYRTFRALPRPGKSFKRDSRGNILGAVSFVGVIYIGAFQADNPDQSFIRRHFGLLLCQFYIKVVLPT